MGIRFEVIRTARITKLVQKIMFMIVGIYKFQELDINLDICSKRCTHPPIYLSW